VATVSRLGRFGQHLVGLHDAKHGPFGIWGRRLLMASAPQRSYFPKSRGFKHALLLRAFPAAHLSTPICVFECLRRRRCRRGSQGLNIGRPARGLATLWGLSCGRHNRLRSANRKRRTQARHVAVETAVPENIEAYLGLEAIYEKAHRDRRYKIEDEE
jgi:hypothetical protein